MNSVTVRKYSFPSLPRKFALQNLKEEKNYSSS